MKTARVVAGLLLLVAGCSKGGGSAARPADPVAAQGAPQPESQRRGAAVDGTGAP